MKKRTKNKIIKAITWIMAIVFIFAVCALDSGGTIAKIICFVTEIYFVLFMYANRNMRIEW